MGTRIRFVGQVTDSDCGAACIAMILQAYGMRQSLYEVRSAFEKFGPIQSANTLITGARALGIDAGMAKVTLNFLFDRQGRKEANAQVCLLHWNFNHWVVAHRTEDNKLEIHDPSIGRIWLSREDVSNHFTGVALLFRDYTPENATISMKKKRVKLPFGDVDRKEYIRLLSALVFGALLVQGIALIPPFFVKTLVDGAVASGIPINWVLAASVIGLVVSAMIFAIYFQLALASKLQTRLSDQLYAFFAERMLKMPLGYFVERSPAEIQSRMNSASVLQDAASSKTVSSLTDVFSILVLSTILVWISPLIGVLIIALAAAHVALTAVSYGRDQILQLIEERASARYQGVALETVEGIETIKALPGLRHLAMRWKIRREDKLRAVLQARQFEAYFSALAKGIEVLGPMVLALFIAVEFQRDSLTLGDMFLILSIGGMVLGPISSVGRQIRQLVSVRVHADRYLDLWRSETEAERGLDNPHVTLNSKIEVSNVTFFYSDTKAPALGPLSLEIPLGESFGVVGATGSGKSTLLKMLAGLLEPTSGDIRFCGKPLKNISRDSISSQMLYVPQQAFLMNDSIRNNVTLLRSGIDDDVVYDLLVDLGFADYLKSQPMGLDQFIGSGAARLSGGQKQRLALARALITRPPILLLDEVTSALDVETESRVMKVIGKWSGSQILVTHRLSLLNHCSAIAVLEGGKLQEVGSHAELMRSSRFYAACVGANRAKVA